MAKKSTNKKLRISRLSIVVAILVVSQAATLYWLYTFYNAVVRSDESRISQLINNSEIRSYSNPVISVNENRVYIPELRVYMPLNETSRHMRYVIWEMTDSPVQHVYLSINSVVGNQIVPGDDPTCDKMVKISTENKADSYEKFVGQVKSSQGLKYVFQHDTCGVYPTRPNDSLKQLTNAALAIKEY